IIWKTYLPGQRVVDEGEPNVGVHVVCNGVGMQTILDGSGKEYMVDLLGTGDLIELADMVLATKTYSASASTLVKTQIGFASREMISAQIERDNAFILKIAQQLSRKIKRLEVLYNNLQSRTVSDRLAHIFLQLADMVRPGIVKEIGLPIRLKRTTLGQLVCTAPETASRSLIRLRQKGLISQKDHEFIIPDRKRLADAIGRID
ncbi:MAG: transcriptional regulator, Crp/Fnr family, partial [Gammaproteobacteria bacterium]|nr:transcriptional regulator, Crp/Fnr family [Gammaproteobacteria bacterium]